MMFTSKLPKVYFLWEDNKTRTYPPRVEAALYSKRILEKEASNITHGHGLVDIREDHRNLPEQDLGNITMEDFFERVFGMKSWIAPAP